jgi:casein kinase 1
MERLDRNLEEIFVERGKKFGLQTTALIAGQMVTALRDLHDAGYLHRDLKPENMMLHSDEHRIKLIDFGLADHLKVRRATTLIGNVRFCSRGSHFGLSSKKDDLESLLYVLFYFATGSLPWQNSSKQDIEAEIHRRTDLPLPSQPDTPILAAKGQFLALALAAFPPSKNEIKLAFFS